MTDDTRDELARLGVARAGIARAGLARSGYAPTVEELLQRVLGEHADIRKRLERVEAAQAAARREGGRHSKDKDRRERAALARQIDAAVKALVKQEKKASLLDAARHVLRKTQSEWWNTLTPPEKAREAARLIRRYHREKAAAKKV